MHQGANYNAHQHHWTSYQAQFGILIGETHSLFYKYTTRKDLVEQDRRLNNLDCDPYISSLSGAASTTIEWVYAWVALLQCWIELGDVHICIKVKMNEPILFFTMPVSEFCVGFFIIFEGMVCQIAVRRANIGNSD